ncbi:MAG: hypothetical protein ACRC4L_00170 [Mycoplasma sp.]
MMWISSIVTPFIYCFILPILMQYTISGDNFRSRELRCLKRSMKKISISSIDEFIAKEISNIELYNLYLEVIINEIRSINFSNKVSIVYLLFSVVLVTFTLLATFGII